jgi:hypothetical protein
MELRAFSERFNQESGERLRGRVSRRHNVDESDAPFGQLVSRDGRRKIQELQKVNEPCGYVYENKGSVFHGQGTTGNVIENKSSYASKAGMLLKRQVVSRLQALQESQKWQARHRSPNDANGSWAAEQQTY